MSVLALAFAAVLLLWAAVLLTFSGPLVARWREPVLRQPVLIIESDDWGAGPLAQAEALVRLSALLQGIRDVSGRPAIMTLGVILEVPDGVRIAESGGTTYHALTLADSRFAHVRAAMHAGIQAGVLVPQLHGQCHYWPASVLAAAQSDESVRKWLASPEPASTEDLPSHLQTRWTDASSLPSKSLMPEAVQQAAAFEIVTYQTIFGCLPKVAVATTFVWNDTVEAAWAQAGIEVIVTPGHRATTRNAMGLPGDVDAFMLTGERSLAGPTYLVRDVYFEPALGHGPGRLVEGLNQRIRQGRACLVETHRFNFLQSLDTSLAALESGLNSALTACPALRFISPLELAHAMTASDPVWIETRLMPRLAAWCARLDEIPRFRRVAQLSGLVWPLAWLERAA